MVRIETILDRYNPWVYDYEIYYIDKRNHKMKAVCGETRASFETLYQCIFIDLEYAFNEPQKQKQYFQYPEDALAKLPPKLSKINILKYGEVIKTYYDVKNPFSNG